MRISQRKCLPFTGNTLTLTQLGANDETIVQQRYAFNDRVYQVSRSHEKVAKLVIGCFIYLCALTITPSTPEIQWDALEETTLSTEYEWLEESPRVKWLQWWMGVDQDGVYGRITHKHHRQWAMERNIRVRLYSTVSPNATFRPEVERYRGLVTEAVTYYGGRTSDINRFLHIMECESGGDPDAYNPSGASGLMQQMSTWWESRARAAGFEGASPFDPRANIFVSGYLIYRSPNSWHHWVCS